MKANYGTFKSLTCLKTTYHCDGCTFIKLKFIVVISTCIKIRIKTKSDFEETPSPYMYEGSSFNSAAAVTFPTGGNIVSTTWPHAVSVFIPVKLYGRFE